MWVLKKIITMTINKDYSEISNEISNSNGVLKMAWEDGNFAHKYFFENINLTNCVIKQLFKDEICIDYVLSKLNSVHL